MESYERSALMGGISKVCHHILHFNVAASSPVIFNLMKYRSALGFDQSFLSPQSLSLVCFFFFLLNGAIWTPYVI